MRGQFNKKKIISLNIFPIIIYKMKWFINKIKFFIKKMISAVN
jgi:hypothetical protein